jgi:hypothetical protein
MQGEKPEKHPSGAKARVDFAGFMYGLKPVPFTEMSFSAACEAPAPSGTFDLHLWPSLWPTGNVPRSDAGWRRGRRQYSRPGGRRYFPTKNIMRSWGLILRKENQTTK